MIKYKLARFDTDGTLIKERGIFVIAEKKGFYDDLIRLIRDDNLEYYQGEVAYHLWKVFSFSIERKIWITN